MPSSYPPELRGKVLDLLKAGRTVAPVAADLQISDQTIYNWRQQELISTNAAAALGLAQERLCGPAGTRPGVAPQRSALAQSRSALPVRSCPPLKKGTSMPVAIGVDPHKASHTAAVLNEHGQLLARQRIPATLQGYQLLLQWAGRWLQRCWAVEGAHGIGRALAQRLVGDGEQVVDVPAGAPAVTRWQLASELVADVRQLEQRIAEVEARIKAAVAQANTSLLGLFGVGPVLAATFLGEVGDVRRFPSKHHFAAHTGTAPLEASSGQVVRHRLSRSGDRKLNHALYMMAVVQVRRPSPGQDYYRRKLAEGKAPKEALRCLKRRLSDVVYRCLLADQQLQRTRVGCGRCDGANQPGC
jgi:Transposase IS116/IS110/IS902 family